MVLLHSTKYLNRWLGPFLLRNGVRLRKNFVPPGADQPYVDALLGISLGQWLIGLEARDRADELLEAKRSSSNKEMSKTITLEEEAALRVKVLQDHVKPALLPNESWKDIADNWQFYPRLIRWLRREYLNARYGPHVKSVRDAYPALAKSPQFSFDVPPKFANLPSSSMVEACLCYSDPEDHGESSVWNTTKNRNKLVESMKSLAKQYGGTTNVVRGGALAWNELPMETSLAKAPLSHVLQLVGANVQHSGPLNTWLEQRNQFQLWTNSYIAQLGNYLIKRCKGPTTILDVGAGDGLLTALLEDYVQNHANKQIRRPRPRLGKLRKGGTSVGRRPRETPPSLPVFVATDNESWSIRKKSTVYKMDYRQALEKYCAGGGDVIVLCSWMPMLDDWTAAFRQHAAVKEYILIGEADDGNSGDHWQTWGNLHFREDGEGVVPPFKADGFSRHDLEYLAPYQFSRYDSSVSKDGATVSFRRKE